MPKAERETASRFAGFADREGRFFRRLAKHQSREWFTQHRAEYDEGWHAPMLALLNELRERLAPRYRREELAAPKVFRIHRDVRFSKDKAPYKTHIGGYLALAGTGAGPSAAAALYFHVAADEVFAAAGQYMMDGEQLKRFRAALVDAKRGKQLGALLGKLARAKFAVGSHEQLQRVPRGYDPEHPRADLLRRKGLIVSFPTPSRALLTSRKLVDSLASHATSTVPLVEWLAEVTL
jgi:uncharacterized protein (TIGR02453 family)